MKFLFTLFAVLAVSLAVKVHEDPKDKRDASEGYQTQYPSTSYQGPATNYQALDSHFPAQSYGHDENTVSIGAGYSIGAKPSFDLGSSGYQVSSESLPASGHASIQLAPLTIQPSQSIGSHDLNELMNQISQGLNSGAISLSSLQGHGQGGHGQELSPVSFGHNVQLEQSSVPSYAAGTKGLGSYGSTGPVLFNPAESSHNSAQSTLSFAAPVSAGHSFGDANTLSLSDAGHSFAGLSLSPAHGLGGLGGHGLSFASGGHGHSLGGLSLSGGSVHPLGGSISFAGPGGHSFGAPLKSGGSYSSKPSFKPSAYLGSSSHGDSHGISAFSGSYAPSFGSHSLSGGHALGGHALSGGHSLSAGHGLTGGQSFSGDHGLSGLQALSGGHGHSFGSGHGFSGSSHGLSGSSHGLSGSSQGPSGSSHGFSGANHALSSVSHGSFPSFSGGAPKLSHFSHKPEGYMSLEGISAHLSSPSFGHGHGLTASHAASSHTPQYHSSPSKYNKYSEGGSYKGHGYSPKHYRSAPTSRRGAPKDNHGAYSETVYNTIKYSEELKPRAH